MAMLMPVLGQVGLQLLLTPASSNFIFKCNCLVLGTAYPIYSSLALLESDAPPAEREREASQWLTYWAVFGVLSAAEQLIEKKPWGYYHIKLLFLIWLQSSRYQGARRLYVTLLRPLILQHMPQIETSLQLFRHFMRRPEVSFLGDWLHVNIAKVPYLEWLVRPFDGPSVGPDGRRFFL